MKSPPIIRNYKFMDIMKMLSERRTEQQTVEEAIMALERLAVGTGKRRGRQPKWMKVMRSPEANGASRKRVSSRETRGRMTTAQRRRWSAAKRKSK